jgi:hypothetical protein
MPPAVAVVTDASITPNIISLILFIILKQSLKIGCKGMEIVLNKIVCVHKVNEY